MAIPSGFWKITTKFNQPPYGWSETWYMTAANIATAATWLATYLTARARLMPSNAVFVAATISDPNNQNISQLFGRQSPALGQLDGSYTNSTTHQFDIGEPSDAALRVYVVTASQKHRVFMMTAIPQEIQNGNRYIRQPNWTALWPMFQNALTGSPGSSTTIGQLKILDQTQIKFPLVSAQINTVDSRFMQFVTSGSVKVLTGNVLVDIQVGAKVLIRRVQPSIEVNRIWLVNSITANFPLPGQFTYVLGPHKTLGQINSNLLGVASGYVRPVVFIGDNILSVTDLDGIWNRRRGKQYGLPVGRRKVR